MIKISKCSGLRWGFSHLWTNASPDMIFKTVLSISVNNLDCITLTVRICGLAMQVFWVVMGFSALVDEYSSDFIIAMSISVNSTDCATLNVRTCGLAMSWGCPHLRTYIHQT